VRRCLFSSCYVCRNSFETVLQLHGCCWSLSEHQVGACGKLGFVCYNSTAAAALFLKSLRRVGMAVLLALCLL
jgi:hypothetical protein